MKSSVTDRSGMWKSATVSRAGRPRTSRRDDLVTAASSTWLVLGLFIDGWAHNNLQQVETFVTPWHAVLYSGFLATSAWIGWLVVRSTLRGYSGPGAIPVGYGLGLAGVGLFAAAGITDFIWHTVLGIEASIEALLSPPHLLLLTAGLLMVTSPFRAAWSSADPRSVSWGRFLPPLLSLALSTAAVAFFFQYASAFLSRDATIPDAAALARLPGGYVTRESSQIIGILSVMVTNLILMAPVLLIFRRWHPPFGSVTLLFTAVGMMMASQHEFEVGITVFAALVGGVAADVLIYRLRPSPSGLGPHRLVAVVVPVVLWTMYFGLLDLQFEVAWVTELWSGTIVLAALSGLALSLLMAPPVSGADPEV